MTIRYRWHPSWWRTTTWPEFKLLVLMMNEGARRDPDPGDPDDVFGDDGETATGSRHYGGRTPTRREYDLLLDAHNGTLMPPTVPGG